MKLDQYIEAEETTQTTASPAADLPSLVKRSFWIQVREVTSVLGRRKTFFRAIDTETGELITSSPQRRCVERVPVEVYGYAPISSENVERTHGGGGL
jgi:hypothetical protein